MIPVDVRLRWDLITSEASVAPPQCTMHNVDDRNRLLLCILIICKDVLGLLPKVVGIDVVEMAFWAKVLQGLEAATHYVEDMDEWLGIFNVKLQHTREVIESVGTFI